MKSDKRKRILDAAEALFASRRFHEITVEEIARKAGVGKGTVYCYFSDKDSLYAAVVLNGYDDLIAMIERETGEPGDFREQLERIARRLGEYHRRRFQRLQMMHGEDRRAFSGHSALHKEWIQRWRRMVDIVAGIMRRGREQGRVRGDIPDRMLALFFLGLLRVRGSAARKFPELAVGPAAAVDFFCRGACPAGEGLKNGEDESP